MEEKYNQAMEEFSRIYSSVENPIDADEILTTREIHDRLKNLFHDKTLKIQGVYDLLIDHGFQYTYFLEEFVWPLKRKKN